MQSIELEIWRLRSNGHATIGELVLAEPSGWHHLCWTCEDEYRTEKVRGETRIPAGRYRVKFRDDGGMATRYKNSFGSDWHPGMLWLQDVPGFEWVYMHIGNDDDDTEGCPLLGLDQYRGGYAIGRSRAAYTEVYPLIRDALLAGLEVWVTIRDLDRPRLPSP